MMTLLLSFSVQSQEIKRDTTQHIKEVKVTSRAVRKVETDLKMAVSVDEFLASSNNISFIKRGAFAWEPQLNNMSSERSVVTIDGMHIFGACTDKMDPVTSYVESNNLSTIEIKSGQEGSAHGATVAGSIDLKRKSTAFGLDKKWNGSYQTGFEANNKQFFNLGNIAYSGDKIVADGSFSFRKASNYSDGNGQKINHSQYQKMNTSLGLGYKTSELSSVRLDAILDVAKDVGFPALPMDLWLSRALITSVAYKQMFEEGLIRVWDSKLYFNTIEHYMDDTTRPENLVHMDMPGWSTTYGLTSRINLKKDQYAGEIQLNAYDNTSIAEMRMYPQDRSERSMFAYSWPWVTTRYVGISMSNGYDLSTASQVTFGGSLGWNYNRSKYVEFNRIFHPEASQEKNRILPNLHLGYSVNWNKFDFSVGTGYGHRAPSVSEGYGYYIYNSFDRYDYIGNPDLENEVSYELNGSASYSSNQFTLQANANYFHIDNYIVGRILSMGSPMNYQSVGVKGYTSVDYARLFNFSFQGTYNILDHLHWKGKVAYAKAQDNKGGNLPFIRPLTYETALHYQFKQFSVQSAVHGDFKQSDYSPFYGEDETPAYTIWNASADYSFHLGKTKAVVQFGVENILNEYYSTYADWGNIPRMGRNFFSSLKINF